MENKATVVVLRSLSFTGTTWLNCLLGCQERSFALGAPDRAIRIFDQGDTEWRDACRVHGQTCPFWPAFSRTYDPKGNFYLQLAEFSGRDFIVMNNPSPGTKATLDLRHPDLACIPIHLVRDGRAVCSSFLDKNPDKDFLYSVMEWFFPSASAFFFDEQDPDTLCLRYEDVVSNPAGLIQRIGRWIGLDYPEDAHRFWEFEHHLTAGNRSVPGMIRRFQTGTPFPKKDAFYENEFQRLQRQPDRPLLDERWKERLGRRERFLFDRVCGRVNESWGYGRDAFTATEFETYRRDFDLSKGRSVRRVSPSASTANLTAGEGWKEKARRFRSLVRNGGVISPSLLRWFFKRLLVGWVFSLLLVIIVAVILTWIVMG